MARTVLILSLSAGLLLCPYACMRAAAADLATPSVAESCGCGQTSCRHDGPKSDGSHDGGQQPDDCCSCSCDGTIVDTSPRVFQDFSSVSLAGCVAVLAEGVFGQSFAAQAFVNDREMPKMAASGRGIRVRISSFVI